MNLIDQWNQICADQRRVNSDKDRVRDFVREALPKVRKLRDRSHEYLSRCGTREEREGAADAWGRAVLSAERGDVSGMLVALRRAEKIEDERRAVDPKARRAENFARAALELFL